MGKQRGWIVVWVVLVMFGLLGPAQAQESTLPGWLDVFVAQDAAGGSAQVYFVDALSGLSTVVRVENGAEFTLVGDYVLYSKPRTGAIMRANPDGTIQPHPFIHRPPGAQSVQWVVSPDRRAVAWVQVDEAGQSSAFVAWADGSDLRQLPLTSPQPPLQIAPLVLTNDRTHFYYDAAHPAEPGPYPVYAEVAGYDIAGELLVPVPGEPNCPCAAAISPESRSFARLEASRGAGTLHLWDLPTGADILIAPPNMTYDAAGDLVLNASGSLAVYSVQRGTDPAEYALVLAEVVSGRQNLALDFGPVRYRPVEFIDEDGALLLVGEAGGTYKLQLLSGEVIRVSTNTYLGRVVFQPRP